MDITAAVQRWWSDQRQACAYQALGREEREALARDAGVAEDTLAWIVSRGSSAGEELPRLLRAIGLDREDLQRTHPEVMRDMQVTCSTCAVAKQCRRDLDRGMSRLIYRDYCPNAETIAALDRGTRWRDIAPA